MKYLLGPVSVTAAMTWCPQPKKADFQKPLIVLLITGMKYLLGPVSVTAEMAWCPEPKKADFQKPLIDLSIKMQVRDGYLYLLFQKVKRKTCPKGFPLLVSTTSSRCIGGFKLMTSRSGMRPSV
jgi:hypothetical protein